MTDVFISGGGVLADQPLPLGTRMRFRPTSDDPAKDIEVYVSDGVLHLVGHYSKLSSGFVEANHVVARGI